MSPLESLNLATREHNLRLPNHISKDRGAKEGKAEVARRSGSNLKYEQVVGW